MAAGCQFQGCVLETGGGAASVLRTILGLVTSRKALKVSTSLTEQVRRNPNRATDADQTQGPRFHPIHLHNTWLGFPGEVRAGLEGEVRRA